MVIARVDRLIEVTDVRRQAPDVDLPDGEDGIDILDLIEWERGAAADFSHDRDAGPR
jgi:hypothetical protein